MSSSALSGISILNDVIGPVMRGPSSSHTAGPFFIGRIVRAMTGEKLAGAQISFDPAGSFAHVYREQRSDVGFAAGLLGMALTDDGFADALAIANRENIQIEFQICPLPDWTHPNTVRIHASCSDGRSLSIVAESIGGGQICFRSIDGVRLNHRCERPIVLVAASADHGGQHLASDISARVRDASLAVAVNAEDPTASSVICSGTPATLQAVVQAMHGNAQWTVRFLPAVGLVAYHASDLSLFDVQGVLDAASRAGESLANIGIRYEASLLRIRPCEALRLMADRWSVMKAAVHRGLSSPAHAMRFLTSTARTLRDADREHRLVCGGLLAQASAAALAVMEQNATGGVICAAPTAGSAGIIPGLLFALQQADGFDDNEAARLLFATGVVGVMIATRASFAAETCACAAETGAAASMAAAALVQFKHGSVVQALDAATMCLMNTIGLTCDPVQGAVEIPCHARNLAGVAHALVAADSVLGGFRAVLPLDQTIDAMLAVGRSMPSSVRCTSRGGLAATPAARSLVPLRIASQPSRG